MALQRALRRGTGGSVQCLAATVAGVPVGKAVVDFGPCAGRSGIEFPPAGALIAELEVHPGFRGRGIGTRMVRAAEEVIARRGRSEARIAVDDDNLAARRLYERLGYRPVDSRRAEWVERWPDGRVRHRASRQTLLARPLAAG